MDASEQHTKDPAELCIHVMATAQQAGREDVVATTLLHSQGPDRINLACSQQHQACEYFINVPHPAWQCNTVAMLR
jgi:hypothetical protein